MSVDHVVMSNIETAIFSSYFGHPSMLGLVLECHTENFEGEQINCSVRASHFLRAPNF